MIHAPSPRPDLPVLMIFPSEVVAQDHQKRLHPDEFFCIGTTGFLMGRQFRAVFILIDDYHHRYSPVERETIERWLKESVCCRLAPGCQDQFFWF